MSLDHDLDRLVDQQRGVNAVLDTTLHKLIGSYPTDADEVATRSTEPCVQTSANQLADLITVGQSLAMRLAEALGAMTDAAVDPRAIRRPDSHTHDVDRDFAGRLH